MKEYSVREGGRYTYADDLLNLQDLALAITAIFDQCDNFIVSGCQVNGSQISPGYVYINGKLRYFNGASEITTWPQYIYEKNTTQSIAYESGTEQIGRTIYACEIASSIPSSKDPITGLTPEAIQVHQTGGLTLKDAFIGKYALLLNPSKSQQTVSGSVGVDALTVNSGQINQTLSFPNGNTKTQMSCQGGVFTIQCANDTKTFKMVFNPNTGLSLYSNNTVIFESVDNDVSVKKITGDSVKSKGLMMQSYHLMDYASIGTGRVYINYLGYNAGAEYYRNTTIGNGKREVIVEFNGEDKSSVFYGEIKTSKDIVFSAGQGVLWNYDNCNAQINIQSISGANALSISHQTGDISIIGKTAVNIGPVIKENGVKLSDKYLSVSTYNSDIQKKADIADIYNKSASDERFVQVSQGFTQIAKTESDKTKRRNEIGATDLESVKNTCAVLSNLLSDMAKTAEDKQKICSNIGAAEANKVQSKLTYSSTKFGDTQNLIAYQYGNIVTITGSVVIPSNSTQTTVALPNNITGISTDVNYVTTGCTYSSPMHFCQVSLNYRTITVFTATKNSSPRTFNFTLTFII